MRHTKKKVLSLFLAMILLLNMFPATAFALEGSPAEAGTEEIGNESDNFTATKAATDTETSEIAETPAPSETPLETESPEVTAMPETTEAPVVTEAPEITESPATTEVPEPTETSEPTETPEATETAETADVGEPVEAPKEEPAEAPKEEPAEAPKEEPVEAPKEEPAEEPENEPESVELNAVLNEGTEEEITVSVLGAPAGATLNVKAPKEGYETLLPEDVQPVLALDIDVTAELPEAVTVKIKAACLAELSEAAVLYHIENGVAGTVDFARDGGSIRFSSRTFSPFIIVEPVDEEPEQSLEETHPAFAYSDIAGGMAVDIAAPVGAFPAGTTVTVATVETKEILDAVEAAVDETVGTASSAVEVQVTTVRAVDITFFNAEGEEIQPLLPISVALCPVEQEPEAVDVAVIHIDEDGNGTALEAVEQNGEAVSFAADSFSIYAYAQVITKRVLDSHGSAWDVSVTFDSAAQIPEGSTLEVRELTPSDAAFEEYMDKARDALYENPMVELSDGRMFDITILSPDGEEIQPAVPVQVTITLAEGLAVAESEAVHALHVDQNEQIETVDAESNATADEIVLTAEGFSVYIIVVGPIDDSYLQKTWENERFRFTVGYTEAAGIPDEAELRVRQILSDTEEFAYNEARAEEAIGGFVDARAMLDIGLYVDGRVIEPLTDVYLSIQLKDTVNFSSGEAYGIIHLDDAGGVDVSAPMAMDSNRTIGDTISGFSTFIIQADGTIKWINTSADYDPDWLSRGGTPNNYTQNLPLGTAAIIGTTYIASNADAVVKILDNAWLAYNKTDNIVLKKNVSANTTVSMTGPAATIYYPNKVMLQDGSTADLLITLSNLERRGGKSNVTANIKNFFTGSSVNCNDNQGVSVDITMSVQKDGVPLEGYTLLFGASDLDQPDHTIGTSSVPIYRVSTSAASPSGLVGTVATSSDIMYTEPMTAEDTPVQIKNSAGQLLYYKDESQTYTTAGITTEPTAWPVYAKYKVFIRTTSTLNSNQQNDSTRRTEQNASGMRTTAYVSMEPAEYTEAMQIVDGRVSQVYVPNNNYIHYEDYGEDGVRLVGIINDSSSGISASGTAATGFFILGDAKGLTFRFTAGSGCGTALGSSTAYVRIISSTGAGGNITTVDKDVQGNTTTYGPGLLAVPMHKTVTYTMTPQTFYHAKTIEITDGGADKLEANTTVINVADLEWDGSGNASYTDPVRGVTYSFHNDSGTITYTFADVTVNHWIHVEWEADPPSQSVTITKVWEDNSNARSVRPDALEVHLRALDESGATLPISEDDATKTELVTGKDVNINGGTSWSKDGNTWTYTFHVPEGLEKFDVYEVVPTDYEGDTSASSTKVFTDYDSVTESGVEIARVYKVTITNTVQSGDLSFKKVDEVGSPVAGAVFAFFTDRDCLYPVQVDAAAYTVTSDSDGLVKINALSVGSYYMKESEAGDLYAENNTLYKVTLHSDPATSTIEVVSADTNGAGTLTKAEAADYTYTVANKTAEYTIRLRKTNNAGDRGLTGGVFDLYDTNPSAAGATPVKTGITSGENGYVTIEGTLKAGTWYLIETQAPESAQLIETPIVLTIKRGSVTAIRGEQTLTVAQGTGGDSNRFTVTIPDPLVDMRVVKELYTVNGEAYNNYGVKEGDVLVYRISVINSGEIALDDVKLTDVLTITARSTGEAASPVTLSLSNTDGIDPASFDIPVGGTIRFLSEEVTVGKDDNLFYNVATAKAGELEKSANVTTPVKHVILEKKLVSLVRDGETVDNPEYALPGDSKLTYTVTMTNDGTAAFTNNQNAVNFTDTTTITHKEGEPTEIKTTRGTGNQGLAVGASRSWTYTINYTVTENDLTVGNIAVPTIGDPDEVEIPVLTEIHVKKVWSDAENQDGVRPASVEIKLLADGTAVEGKTLTLSESNSWEGSFTELPKSKDGVVIVYTVEETKTDIITGTDDAGTYAVAISGDAENGFTVTNTHTPETIEISVKKVWNDADNQDGIRPGSVTIQFFANGNDAERSLILSESNGWAAALSNLPRYNAGTEIVYTVEEVKTDAITGTDGAGTYAIAVSGDIKTGFTVTNTHTPETIDIPVEKVWEDNNNAAGHRPDSVEIKLLADGEERDSASLSADNSWKNSFEDLPVYQAGKAIKYSVEELAITGYTAVVTGDAENGFTVTNTICTPVTDDPPVKKILLGNEPEQDETFRFVLKADDSTYPMPEGAANGQKTVTVTGAGETEFGDIIFTFRGTYTYTIYEDAGSTENYDYDGSVYAVTYKVTQDGDRLVSERTVTKDGEAVDMASFEFTNVYQKTTAEIEVSKTLKGRDWEDGDSFTFTLAPDDESNPTPATDSVTVKSAAAVSFGEIIYTEVGTYIYTITETKGTLDGVDYDTAAHKVTVTVTEDENKALVAEVDYAGAESLSVINTFSPATVELEVIKKLTGREWTDADSFSFTLAAVQNEPMPEAGSETVAVTKAEQSGSFGVITFNKAGTYSYTITEVEGELGGVTYDSKSYAVVVTVSRDEETNALSAEVSYDGSDALTIENIYAATGSVTLEAKKELTGRALAVGEFSFTLLDSEGKELETVKNAADGSIVFKALEYSLEDIGDPIVYTIREDEGELEGVTYEEKQLTVTVTLSDNGDGTLDVVTSYEGLSDNTFVNTYESSGELTLNAVKKLIGHSLEDGQFHFELLDADGKVLQTVTNDADGNIAFEALTYDRTLFETEEGYAEAVKLSYTIREVNDEQPGYTYDSTEYTINVTLTDDGAGNILAEIENGNGETAYRFVNSHTPEPTPTPTPTPSETPKPSETPRPSVMPEPSVTPKPSVTPEPSVMPEPGETPKPSVMPEPGETPKPSVMPEPSVTPEPGQKKESPKTGDDNNLGLWVSLMGVALAGMIAVVFTSRRRRTGKHSK